MPKESMEKEILDNDGLTEIDLTKEGLVNSDLDSAIKAKSIEAASRKGVAARLKELKAKFDNHIEEKRKENRIKSEELDRQIALSKEGKSELNDPLKEPQAEKSDKINFFPDVDETTKRTNAELKGGEKQFFNDVVNGKPDNSI
jgi:hypothetical protein